MAIKIEITRKVKKLTQQDFTYALRRFFQSPFLLYIFNWLRPTSVYTLTFRKGEEITIQYITFLFGNAKRRKEIKVQRYYVCLLFIIDYRFFMPGVDIRREMKVKKYHYCCPFRLKSESALRKLYLLLHAIHTGLLDVWMRLQEVQGYDRTWHLSQVFINISEWKGCSRITWNYFIL